jgi:hypothetical protein
VLLREGLVRFLAEDGHQVVAAVGDGLPWSRRCSVGGDAAPGDCD